MINWGKLKEQGRAKDIGVPWNNEELNAIHKLKIPFNLVKKGILTLEQLESETIVDVDTQIVVPEVVVAPDSSEKRLTQMNKEELLILAEKIELPQSDVEAMKRHELIKLINSSESLADYKAKSEQEGLEE